MRVYKIIFLFAICLFAGSNTNAQDVSDARAYMKALREGDITVKQACEEFPQLLEQNNGDQLVYLIAILNTIIYQYDLECALQYEDEVRQRVRASNDSEAARYFAQYSAQSYMRRSDYVSAIREIDSALAIPDVKKWSLQASLYTMRGSAYYYQRKYHEAAESFAQSVECARRDQDTIQLISALVNSGSAYNGLGYNHTALKYFEDAYALTKNNDAYQDLTIRNNLSAVLLDLNYFEQASVILEDLIKDPQLYDYVNNEARFLAYANAAQVCAHDSTMMTHCDSIYQMVRFAFENTKHYKTVVSTMLYMLYYEDFGVDRANAFLESIRHEVLRDTASFIADYDFVLYTYFRDDISNFPFTHTEWSAMHRGALDSRNNIAIERYYAISALLAMESEDYEMASQCWVKADSMALLNRLEEDSTRVQDFAAKFKLDIINLEKEAAQSELKAEKRLSRIYQYAMYGALLLGVIIVILLLSNIRKSAKAKKLAEEETAIIQKEKEVLEREKLQMSRELELDNRIISFSSFVMENGLRWYERLKNITEKVKDSDVKRELLDIRHNLQLFLKANENTDSNELLSVALRNQEGLIADPEVANELNSTERRVLALTSKGLSTKEIADLLGFSVAYVNNIRSGIRKKLNIPPKTSIEDFIATESLDR